MRVERQGTLFVICGPSGAGKGTIWQESLKHLDNICLSVSATTREPRDGEIDGTHYFFISSEEFRKRIDADEFCEWNFHFGNYYGTPKAFIENKCAQGIDVILDIDVKGALILLEKKVNAVYVFLLPPSREELEKRLRNRKTESSDKIAERLERASWENSQINKFDYLVINDDIKQACNDFISIIRVERSRVSRINLENIISQFGE